MKERPILFSGPMVRAILEDRKTMTRRVVKDHHIATQFGPRLPEGGQVVSPYGIPGDRLWVRETFADRDRDGDLIIPVYRADGEEVEDGDGFTFTPRWRPSIYMPQRLSRLTLEIVSVRVERLQDISDGDAESEGLIQSYHYDNPEWGYEENGDRWCSPRFAFQSLWDSINAKRGCGWDANPWVWVIEFKKL